jgi:hypothetical protein
MTTLLIQIFISLSISTIIVFLLTLWLTKRSLAQRQVYLESFLEIIPRDAVSHSDRNVVEPKRLGSLDVRVSQFIR